MLSESKKLAVEKKMSELKLAYFKIKDKCKDIADLVEALEAKKNATAEDLALITKEFERIGSTKEYIELSGVVDQMLLLDFYTPDSKYFDLPLDEKVVDEHFKKIDGVKGQIRDRLFAYNDYFTSNSDKSGFKQFGTFHYIDAFRDDYAFIILDLIKRVVKFRFVNGICNTVFRSLQVTSEAEMKLIEKMSVPYSGLQPSSTFFVLYALPLYHLVPKDRITELYAAYNKEWKYLNEKGYCASEYAYCLRRYKKKLSDGTMVDYNAYDCTYIKEYLVNFSAKYFAYNIARFLVKNVAFFTSDINPQFRLDYNINVFRLVFPDTFNLDSSVAVIIMRETVKHLEEIFALSPAIFKVDTNGGGVRIDANFGVLYICSFSFVGTTRSFKFGISLGGVSPLDSSISLNYPYRSFYMPDCNESDEEFYEGISSKDKFEFLSSGVVLNEFEKLALKDKRDPAIILEVGKGNTYFFRMTKAEITYNNLEVKEPFSFERFKWHIEEFRKMVTYDDNNFFRYYFFPIIEIAFYQFEKYLEYELEQYKIKNNINYEQMLEERKSKENKFDFFTT